MKKNRLFGAVLLVSGVTIGAGMLGLPLKTGIGGFFPTIISFTICWFFMYWTAKLFLELSFTLNSNNINLVSMAKKTLKTPGVFLMWFIYLLQLNALIVAYLVHGGALILVIFKNIIDINFFDCTGQFLLLVVLCPFVYFGLYSIDILNRYLMLGLIVTFILMIIFIVNNVQLMNLQHIDYNNSFISITVIITSFGFHVIIPSLVFYLNKDLKQIKLSLLFGTLIPFVVYIVWEFLILGSISAIEISEILNSAGDEVDIIKILSKELNSSITTIILHLFSIIAILTSLIGVGQSLFDFWRDGLRAMQIKRSKLLFCFLTFAPAIIIIIIFQTKFLVALDYAGILIAILLGVFPILMVWKVRYFLKLSSSYVVKGGKISLIFGLAFFSLIIVLALGDKFGILSLKPSDYFIS